MMGRHIRELIKFFFNSEQGQHALNKYVAMQAHEGWKIHTDMMITLKGLIQEDMLSGRYTKLTAEEKDVRQRAYVGVVEVLDFLTNPHAKARTHNAIKTHNSKMGATVKGATERESK